MKPYLSILKTRLATFFQYRTAAIAGFFTQFFWAVIKIMILTAFFAHSEVNQPLSLDQAITFIILGQSLLQLLPWSIDKELEFQVKSGSIAYELLRPIHLYGLFYVRSIAMRLIPTLMRGSAVLILSALLGLLLPPVSMGAGCMFLLSLVGSLFLASAITTLIIISLFWTLSGEGIQRLMPHVAVVFTGMVVPLPLFPNWMQLFLSLQPFRGILDIPSRLYTGMIPFSEAGWYLLFQWLWFVLIVLLGNALLKKATKQLVIQGG